MYLETDCLSLGKVVADVDYYIAKKNFGEWLLCFVVTLKSQSRIPFGGTIFSFFVSNQHSAFS